MSSPYENGNSSAEEIRKKYWGDEIPVDVYSICKKIGIEVRVKDLSILERKFGRKISGLIYVENNDKIIFVNSNDILARRRFTVAHELGHYICHMNSDEKDKVIISYRGLRNNEEREADKFAAELLMPEDNLLKIHNSVPFPTISYLSKIFDVSAAAMKFRLKEMGLKYIG